MREELPMYHKLPIGAIAAGGGIAAVSGVPTIVEIGAALLVSSVLLAAVAAVRRFRGGGRH
jgi:hypothetical protein